jgi:hypothetical protein
MFEYNRNNKRLSWDGVSYSAVSGPYGKGILPAGSYTVAVSDVVVGGLNSSYVDDLTGESWFIPVHPQFATSRRGLGIHPCV